MFYFDPLYLVFALPAMILGLWAQARVRGSFKKYSGVPTGTGINGAQAARKMLDANGLQHVAVERVGGFLSDHYDPRGKVLRLSADVYGGANLAAVGVAAHEAGHALQDKTSYAALRFRSAMVPAVQIGSWLGPIIFFAGLFMSTAFGESIAWFGLFIFGLTALFSIVTLPVEFNASNRAKEQLVSLAILTPQEVQGVNKVLGAAALTYVAAAIQAIVTMLYYASILMRRD
jgi:Zn-dependent membrane protease YugP